MASPIYLPDLIIGIDPGVGGAIALLDIRNTLHPLSIVHDMPLRYPKGSRAAGVVDPAGVAGLIRSFPIDRFQVSAAVEQVGSRPHQAGAFNFGLSTGILHGVLGAFGIPFASIPPSVWKPTMGLGRSNPDETQSSTKNRARALASRLFPAMSMDFSRVKDDGRAEAMLIAYYYGMQLRKAVREKVLA